MAACIRIAIIAPAASHPFHREQLQIRTDRIVIGAFVNPQKLSQRCLSLWREVLEKLPDALFAISPLSPRSGRGIHAPVHRGEHSCRARHRAASGTRRRRRRRRDTRCSISRSIRCLYGGVNSTLEAIDMGVPVVTLRGRKHGERASASILTNLGATQTIADSGSAYVDIAVRLATDPTSRARSRRRSVPESPSRR